MLPELPIALAPYIRQARRLFMGRGTVECVAQRIEILSPIESDCPANCAVFLDGQLERITAAQNGRLKDEIEYATATKCTHGPTLAFHLSNAALVDGTIYADNLKYPISNNKDPSSAILHLKSAAVASSWHGLHYFGHWLMDDCLTFEIARNYDTCICGLSGPISDHQAKYAKLFRQDWTETKRARIEHLVIFDDISQNQYKRERHRRLRTLVRETIPAAESRNVYFRRGHSGTSRLVANEDEIINELTKAGFVVADVEKDRLEDMLSKLANANIVISIEGSHVSHCSFSLDEKAKLLTLQPCDRFAMSHSGWLSCIGAREGFVVGSKTHAGYHFPVQDILKTIDLLERL